MQNRTFELSKEAWSCIRAAYHCPQKVQYMAPYILKKLNSRYSEKKIRRILADLGERGYLNLYDDRVTPKGAGFYRKYESAWHAICAQQYALQLEKEEAEEVADYLVCTYPAGVLEELGEKYETEKALDTREAKSERIVDTDFNGRLSMGVYKVAFDLICLGEERGVYGPCLLGEGFLQTADLIIEPLGSRLELRWTRNQEEFSGILCIVMGEEVFLEAQEGVLSIPVPLISFEYVPGYKILQGRLELWLLTKEGKHRARLELPLLSD